MTDLEAQDQQAAENYIRWGQEALEIEGKAVASTATRVGDSFRGAVETILRCQGRVVVTGLGKSGHVARKIASTFSSTGTASFFLHPTEAMHGDFGMIQLSDVLVAFAFGGETAEVIEVAKHSRRLGVPVIAVTGKASSSLAQLAHFFLDGSVDREVCPLNLAPTTSSTVAMALGDALAVALMRARGFSEAEFAALHPGGSLGRKLMLVQDLMHSGGDLPVVGETAGFHEILEAITKRNFGIVAVASKSGELLGAVSDGDIRRALKRFNGEALGKKAQDLMSGRPKTTVGTALAVDAFRIMEKHQITALFVTESEKNPVLSGIVRMHDLLAAKIV